MNYLDEINRKKEGKKQQQDKDDLLNAVSGSGTKTADAVVSNKEEVTKTLHDLLMATMVGKDPRIAETAKNLTHLLTEVKKATDKIKDANFKPLSDNLGSLITALEKTPAQIQAAYDKSDRTTEIVEALKELGTVVKRQKLDPTINIPKTVIDIDRIVKAIEGQSPDTGIQLDNFKAQDIDEMEPGVQYVGFVNPKGVWYVLKNVEQDNALRYKFGLKGYTKAWPNAPSYKYKVLNEAIDEIQA